MKVLLKFFMLCFFATLAQAHTVWIDTASKAKVNKKHEIKLFFGELDDPTPTAKWFSDIKDMEVKVISPSGKEQIIREKSQNEKYYSAYFTPTEKGVYVVSVNHLVRDLHRGMKITYQSVAYVNTGSENKEVKMGVAPSEFVMNTSDFVLNKDKKIKLIAKGEVKQREKISVESENGWGRTLSTNKDGEVDVKLLWKGKYLISHGVSVKEEGKHNGQDYTLDIKSLTYFVDIK